MKARSSTISPGVLPSYSAPLSRSGAHQFPWGCKLWRWGAQTLSVKSISETPAAPPTPSYTSSKGASALSRASPSLSQMCQVHEPIWGLREKIPPWTKPRWAVRVSVPMEAGMRTQSPVLPLKSLQGPFLPWRKVPAGSHPWSPGPSLMGPRTTVGRLALGGQETTSLLGLVPSEAARIPWYHRAFCTLGNFVSSWRTTIFHP